MEDERYFALAQPVTELFGITVTQAKVQHSSRQAILLDNGARLRKRVCRYRGSTGLLEGCYDVQGDKRLVLNDEDFATSEAGVHRDCPSARQSASTRVPQRYLLAAACSPESRSIPDDAASVMIDDLGPAHLAGANRMLRSS
jgi:hypothetical protein